ncbi:MAG: phosphoribosyltransferase domain-containing protein [Lachnospiraceae bacterium]
MYLEKELVGIAKRENNQKRKYLVVNKLQGKHIPVKPLDALTLFDTLAELLKKSYEGEKLLLVGFAETATAIGAKAAVALNCAYMQTTREIIPNVQYLFFSESHSHATEQKLVKDDLDIILNQIDRIIFIEDEVTTGNTIKNIIHLIQEEYGKEKVTFSIASILNGMNLEAVTEFENSDIPLHFLVKTDHSNYEKIAMNYVEDGEYEPYVEDTKMKECEAEYSYTEWKFSGYQDARRLVFGQSYQEACVQLWNSMKQIRNETKKQHILVLGTEEFMFPALYVAGEMEKLGNEVRFHATTRSPIAVSKETEYPLHHRFELRSLYESQRITYLYELEKYDVCYIITDASEKESSKGMASLQEAIHSAGNCKINVIRWCKE